jgi:hypothetical protein
VDSKDNIYVSDGYVNSRIAKFDKNGNWIKSWGPVRTRRRPRQRESRQHQQPAQHADRLATTTSTFGDRGNRRIQVFDADGNFKYFLFLNAPYDKKHHPTLAPVPANPPDETAPWALCITPTPTQYLFVVDSEPGRLYKMSARRQDPRHARYLRARDGSVQLAARPRCPNENTVWVRGYEQLASAKDLDQRIELLRRKR